MLILFVPLFAVAQNSGEGIDEFWMWIALFTVGGLGILSIIVSSYQKEKMKKVYQEILEKQHEMEKNQARMLSEMGENIHDMVTKALKTEEKGSSKKREIIWKGKEKETENIEEKLLTVTNDLIEFLRLKSEKIEIQNAVFNINNVFNEVSGYICNRYKGKEIDLIFDINNNVPRLLIGDSLHLGQVLNNILDYMMDTLGTGELKLEIEMFNTYEENLELQFRFNDTGNGLSPEELEILFDPYYDDKENRYMRLGLFVSKELVHMMGGELSVQSHVGKGTDFTLTLPFNIFDKKNKRKYHLPQKVLTTKKVFIVDNNYNASLAVKKTFAYFKHEVKILSKEDFLKHKPDLRPYDIIVLHESLFTPRLLEYLKKIKLEKETKVIVLNSLLHMDKRHLIKQDEIDVCLYTPLNQERIFEMIVGMYKIDVDTINEKKKKKPIKTYKEQIPEAKNMTRERFSDFANKRILIVEDNVINQKVLSSLLVPAGVEIALANNGQEAVDMIKEKKIAFDLVLMDINMPILDGYAATEMIRLDKENDTLPIIAVTALVLESEIEKMYSCGINAFLSKPVNVGQLYTALSLYLLEEEKSIPKPETAEKKKEEVLELKGLDTEHGIAHANKSKVLYMEVLKEFKEAYGKSDLLFEKLVKEHRYEQIKMLCVDMRGLTGTIGAHEMLALINKIHQTILYKKEELLVNMIPTYKTEIALLNRAIGKYLALSNYKSAA